MVFWIAVLVGGLFAWASAQVGFFASWIMLFNLVLSAYLAVFLAPLIIDSIPAATDTPYGYALVLLTTAIATLVTAYAVCYTCLSGRIRVEFPSIFDKLGAGVLGFLGGFLASSFVGLAVSLTPLPEIESLRSLGLDAQSQRATRAYVCWWCDVIHGFVGSSESSMTSVDAVDFLLDRVSPPPEEIGPSPAPTDAKANKTEAKPATSADGSKPPAAPLSSPIPPSPSGAPGPVSVPKAAPPIRFP